MNNPADHDPPLQSRDRNSFDQRHHLEVATADVVLTAR